jgi:hypothetical protein
MRAASPCSGRFVPGVQEVKGGSSEQQQEWITAKQKWALPGFMGGAGGDRGIAIDLAGRDQARPLVKIQKSIGDTWWRTQLHFLKQMLRSRVCNS